MERILVGLFSTRPDAERAVDALLLNGVQHGQLSVATRNDADRQAFAGEVATGEAADDVEKEITVSEIAGGLTGLLGGLSAVVLPGVGPLFAAGPLSVAIRRTLEAVGIEPHPGALPGALVELGVPSEAAATYARAIHQGAVLVILHTDSSHEATLEAILRGAGAVVDGHGA